jgi:hypothetical protein
MLSEINLENTKPNSNIIDTLTKSLPQYTIFYAIYTLYRILYIFLFLVPHITNKFKNYLSFIFETNTSFKHELLDYIESEDNLDDMKQFINHSRKTSNNIKERSQNIKKKNKLVLTQLFAFYVMSLLFLLILNLILMYNYPSKYSISLTMSFLYKTIFYIVWVTAISFTFNITATLPYYQDIVLNALKKKST